jgi:flagellar protein FlgJ
MADMPLAGVYTDFQGTMRLSAQAKNDPQGALKEASQQFEGILLQLMLKEMRKTKLSDNPYFDSSETALWRSLLDQQLAIQLAIEEPLGIAPQVRQQLGQEANYDRMNRPLAPMVAYPRANMRGDDLSFSDRQNFIQTLWPHAQKAAQALGVSPKVLIAQAALETGWGKHFAAPHNLFGIKADQGWQGQTRLQDTLEYDGQAAFLDKADFRAYQSYEESFLDYVRFLRENPRYEQALAQASNGDAFLDGLAQAGYATDPQYALKIKSILNGEWMSTDFALEELTHLPIS